MNNSMLVVMLASAVFYGTPIFYAALGEVFAERSGVLNLGVEGMMLLGAVAGSTPPRDGRPGLVVLTVALLAAMSPAPSGRCSTASLSITMRVNQTVSGLALTIFAGAAGLSSYLANELELAGKPARFTFNELDVFGLADAPIVGPILFDQNILATCRGCSCDVVLYWSVPVPGSTCVRSGRRPPPPTRRHQRHAVPVRAHARRRGARRRRRALRLARDRAAWADGITAGRGWIAIALVIFGFWRPDLRLVGAYLFGAFQALAVHTAGARRRRRPGDPPLAAVRDDDRRARARLDGRRARGASARPAALGLPYVREESASRTRWSRRPSRPPPCPRRPRG